MSKVSPVERAARARASRAAAIAGPGSEHSDLRVGERVRVNRALPASGTWSRYDGREGWVAAVNRQRFPDGRVHVEIGVSFGRRPRPGSAGGGVDKVIWFRTDEVVRV